MFAESNSTTQLGQDVFLEARAKLGGGGSVLGDNASAGHQSRHVFGSSRQREHGSQRVEEHRHNVNLLQHHQRNNYARHNLAGLDGVLPGQQVARQGRGALGRGAWTRGSSSRSRSRSRHVECAIPVTGYPKQQKKCFQRITVNFSPL